MIVTITMNPALDKSTSVDKLIPEKKLRCNELVYEAGGGGINVSKALRKLGIDSLAVFPAGGMNGKLLEDHFKESHIRYSIIPIDKETRENIGVMETSTNAQYRFVMPGGDLSPQHADQCVSLLEELDPRPSIIIASGSLPPGLQEDFYARLGDVSKRLDAKYIVDTSGKPLELALQHGVYLIKPNLSELARLVGKEVLEIDEVDDAAMEIVNKYDCDIIVVSLGASGALLVTKDGYEHVPAPTVKKQSTVGAGDSTVAGMTMMLSQGRSLREMVRFGVACGTAATMNPGTSLFNTEDAHRLYKWINQYASRYALNFE